MISRLFSHEGSLLAFMGNKVVDLSKEQRVIFTAQSNLIKPAALFASTLLCADTNKQVYVIDLTGQRETLTRTMERTVTACCISSEDGQLLVADKFGNAFSLGTHEKPHEQPVWILGCISIITDMISQQGQIFTADRDERVRVSRLDKPYVIDQFLLEHSEYVGCLAGKKDSLLTVGGGGEAVEWQFQDGWKIHCRWQDLCNCPFLALAIPDGWAVINDNSSTIIKLLGKTNKHEEEFEGIITACCLHQDQLAVATFADGKTRVYTEKRECLFESESEGDPTSLWRGGLRKLRGDELLASISYKKRRRAESDSSASE